jgi:hypothetical protein
MIIPFKFLFFLFFLFFNFFLSWMQNQHKFLHEKLWEFFSALPVFALGLMQFPADHVNSTIGTAFI